MDKMPTRMEITESIRSVFLTQVLAHLVLGAGGTVRIPKKEVFTKVMTDDLEGILYFDVDGDDLIVMAMKDHGIEQ